MSLSGTRGVFSLRQIYNSQRKGTGYPIADVFTQRPSTPTTVAGYIGGGGPGGTRSWMDKTNYSTDGTAAIPSGYLSVAKWQLGATGSQSAGYYGGGTGTTGSIMDKCTYSTDTTAAAPGANFVAAKSRYAASSSPSDGYFAAGKDSGSTNISSTEKTTFSSDTTAAAPGSNMTATRYAHGATGNSTQGYYGGGKSPTTSDTATVEKLTYSSGTFSSVPNLDSGARFSIAATPSGTHAYFMGGCQGGSARSWVDKLAFSDDTNSAVPGAFLAAARYNGSATGNSTQGYYYGGWTGSEYTSIADKITYSGDTTAASPGSNLIAARGYSAATSAGVNGLPSTISFPTRQFTSGAEQGPNTGYYAGGRVPGPNPSDRSTVDKIDLATETVSNGGNLGVPTDEAGTSSSTSHGYTVGGRSGTPHISSCNKYTFASDTGSEIPGGALTSARYGVMGAGNQDFAFFTGGTPSSTNVTTTEKLTYSSDTTAAAPGSLMPTPGRRGGSSMGNQSEAYFAGNSGGGTQCSKLTYNNESQSNVPSANLIAGRYLLASTGTDTSGYISGGFPSKSSTEKITWATDTCQNLPGAPLSSTRYGQAGTGNNDVGYIGGGSGVVSTIDKIDFNTDTSSTTSSYLTLARRYSNGVGARRDGNPQAPLATPTAQTFPVPVPDAAPPITGYVTSGEVSDVGNVSYSQKLNMSTDAYSIVPSMNLTTTSNGSPETYRTYASSASSPTHGYLMNGYAPNHSNATKVAYVTETFSAIPGNTSMARRSGSQGGGNSSRGYVSGGWSEAISPNGNVSNTDKLVYATETFGRQPSANLSESRGFMGSVCNQSRMLVIGGQNGPSSRSIVDRIDFASDSTDRIPGANDPTPRQALRTNYFPSPERGYTSGGRDSPSNTNYSLTTRFNFSDDTSSAVPGANMTTVRYSHNCTGNTTHTYQSGGNTPSRLSSTDKLNMSTETFGAAPSANMAGPTESGTGYGVYMNGNPSANVPQAPNPTPNYC